MAKHIAAYTALGAIYPEYLNISQDGDDIVVTVRSKVGDDGKCGETVSVKFPKVVFDLMLEDINKNYKV